MSNFIGIYKNAVPKELCEMFIEKHLELQKGCPDESMDGQITNNGVVHRKDKAFFFETHAENLSDDIHAYLNTYISKYLDDHVGLAMNNIHSYACKVQETKKGGGFHAWHNELGYGDSAGRLLTWSVYLNDIPEGEGETEFIEQGLRIPATQGTIVFFPAAWTHTHRGNPVYTKTKYIATGWYYTSE